MQGRTKPDLLAIRLHETYAELKQLSAADFGARRPAFETLSSLFDPWDAVLGPVSEYTEECHRLAHMRAWYRGDDAIQWAEEERRGVACRIFDPAEVKRVLRLR
jgi:hypothetical protein